MFRSIGKFRLRIAAVAAVMAIFAIAVMLTLHKVEVTEAQTSGGNIGLNTPVSFPVDI